MGKMKEISIEFDELRRELDLVHKFLVKQEIRIQDVEHTVHELSRQINEIDTYIEKRDRNK